MSVPSPAGLASTPRLNDLVGNAASAEKIAALSGSVGRTNRTAPGGKAGQAKSVAMLKHLRRALRHLALGEPAKAVDAAMAALRMDERYGLAWHVMAIALEKAGRLEKALKAYEAALRLLPDDPAITADLGSLAQKLGYLDLSEKLYRKHLALTPGTPEVANNLACVLRDDNRYGEAIELLSPLIAAHPTMPLLWNTLGTVVSDRGDMRDSLPFYDEAISLNPSFYLAQYNRANVLMGLGEPERALADIESALVGVTIPSDVATMKMAKAFTQMILGDLSGGFETYEARFDPSLSEAVFFQEHGERWAPRDDISGKSLLIYGEQGLGDEILFANLLGDVINAVGPAGRVILITEGRLAPLFRRSYPTLDVHAHRTVSRAGRLIRFVEFDGSPPEIDLWTPMGSLFRRFRTTVDQFPDRTAFLQADPERVAHWRLVLDEQGPWPKVGLIWKSLVMKGSRVRGFAPFDLWRSVLAVPEIQFVNLQYGDCTYELAEAEAAGMKLWTPPGIDLKADLDDVAALCSALNLLVGPMTATTNIAAACGTMAWVISMPDSWPRFGTDHLPCYPSARSFPADGFGEWDGVMARIEAALRQELAPLKTGLMGAA